MKAKPTKKSGAAILELDRRDEPLLDAATRLAAKSPFQMKRILVPIDFSDCSKKALQYALALAKTHEAAVTLLYVVAPAYGVAELSGIEYFDGAPALSSDGETLFFYSNRPGGFDANDLYMSTRHKLNGNSE